ncbi:hypothetical protein ABFG93_08160 [Pseudalkalibacillus hwajinpoensis]|uniref:hypothetical protein n=1 Tax=Guptibacillus hwajinpoensis TaxID=208199 RepID=UPI00325BA5BD
MSFLQQENYSNRRTFKESSTAFPVAHLSPESLDLLKRFESQLREDANDDIVLIAYTNQMDVRN